MLLGKVNQNVSNIKIRADSQGQKCHVCAKVNMDSIVGFFFPS